MSDQNFRSVGDPVKEILKKIARGRCDDRCVAQGAAMNMQEKPATPKLGNVPRSLLKSANMRLLHAGLVAPGDTERLLAMLGLRDA